MISTGRKIMTAGVTAGILVGGLLFSTSLRGYTGMETEIYRPPELLNPIKIVKNISYDTEGFPEHEHRLDIYYPDDGEPHTVLVFIHGGGLHCGDKRQYEELACTFSSYYDYTTVLINYELSNPDDGQAVHPDHIEDVADAFAWVVEHIDDAEYDGAGDPGRIFLLGQSSGGFLGSLLATDGEYLESAGCSKEQIKGVVTMSGQYDLIGYVEYPGNPYGLTWDEILQYRLMFGTAMGGISPSILLPASPYRHVGPSQPPFCIVYADFDMPGIYEDSMHFLERIESFDSIEAETVRLTREDLDSVWEQAVEAALANGFGEDVAGHWAEIMAINTHDGNPYNTATASVVDFIESH